MAIYRQCKANTSNIAAVIRTAAELFACLIVLDRTLLKLDIKNVDDETAVEPLVIDATVLQYCVISYMHIGYIALSHFEKINSITKTSQSTTLNCSKIISRCHINMNNKQRVKRPSQTEHKQPDLQLQLSNYSRYLAEYSSAGQVLMIGN